MDKTTEILKDAITVERKLAQLADVFRSSEVVQIAEMAKRVREFLEEDDTWNNSQQL